MRIAVASIGLDVSSHFDRCTNFNFYTVEDGAITAYQNLPKTGHPYPSTVSLMKELRIDVVIAGGISQKTKSALQSLGTIVIIHQVSSARQAIEDYLLNDYERSSCSFTNE